MSQVGPNDLLLVLDTRCVKITLLEAPADVSLPESAHLQEEMSPIYMSTPTEGGREHSGN